MYRIILIGLISWWILPNALAADKVTKVFSDGQLEINNEYRVELAGIEIAPEAIRTLPIIVSGKEVIVELEHGNSHSTSPLNISMETNPSHLKEAYVYLDTEEIEVPYTLANQIQRRRIMLNEFLIAVGGAKVRRGNDSQRSQNFKMLQDAAKADEQGIWSYEVSN